ncbi:hypothetical protein MNBD_DELTA03-619 [hydrothermal vent metagenome]|uniref:Uncharacterized protein n=1 Tax=hydrothermal vent metagenome TaxID=652676 RepID=A0A3B0V691_9ZZZZ
MSKKKKLTNNFGTPVEDNQNISLTHNKPEKGGKNG